MMLSLATLLPIEPKMINAATIPNAINTPLTNLGSPGGSRVSLIKYRVLSLDSRVLPNL